MQGPENAHKNPDFGVPGYPQAMQGMHMSMESMMKMKGKRETRGMRHNWPIGPHGLMTVMRVLPEELYQRVMESDEPIEPGEIFDAIVKGNYRVPGRSV